MYNADNDIIPIKSAISDPSPNLIWNYIWMCFSPWVRMTLVRLWFVCTLCTFFLWWALPSLLVFQTAFVWVWVIHTVSEQKLDLALFILACTETKGDKLRTKIVFISNVPFPLFSSCHEVHLESMQPPFDFLLFLLEDQWIN